ncbi:hypothetical protein HN873_008327 [Arachis hypogaea]
MTYIFKYLHSLDVEDFKDMKLGYSITFEEGSSKITRTTIKWKEVLLMELTMRQKETNAYFLR